MYRDRMRVPRGELAAAAGRALARYRASGLVMPGDTHIEVVSRRIRQWEDAVNEQVVTSVTHPYGVRCGNCRRVIENGQPFKLRDTVTGRLSTGPPVEDRVDGVFCAAC